MDLLYFLHVRRVGIMAGPIGLYTSKISRLICVYCACDSDTVIGIAVSLSCTVDYSQ